MAFGNECDFLCGVNRFVGNVAVKELVLWDNLSGTKLSGNPAYVCSSVPVVCVPWLVEILCTAFLLWLILCVSCVLWGSVYVEEHTLRLPSFDCIPLNMQRDRAEKKTKKKQVPIPSSGFISQKIKAECDAVLWTFEADFFFFFCCADVGGLSHLSVRRKKISHSRALCRRICQKRSLQSVCNKPNASHHLHHAFAFVCCFEYLFLLPRYTDCR